MVHDTHHCQSGGGRNEAAKQGPLINCPNPKMASTPSLRHDYWRRALILFRTASACTVGELK